MSGGVIELVRVSWPLAVEDALGLSSDTVAVFAILSCGKSDKKRKRWSRAMFGFLLWVGSSRRRDHCMYASVPHTTALTIHRMSLGMKKLVRQL